MSDYLKLVKWPKRTTKNETFISFMSREIRLSFVLRLLPLSHYNLMQIRLAFMERSHKLLDIKLADCRIAIIALGASSVFITFHLHFSRNKKHQRSESRRWWSEIHIIKFYESEIKGMKRRMPCVYSGSTFSRLKLNSIKYHAQQLHHCLWEDKKRQQEVNERFECKDKLFGTRGKEKSEREGGREISKRPARDPNLQLKYLVSINKYLWTKICCHYAASVSRRKKTKKNIEKWTNTRTNTHSKSVKLDFNLFWFKRLKLYNSHENLTIIILNKNSALSTSIGSQSINWLLISSSPSSLLHLKWWSPLNN